MYIKTYQRNGKLESTKDLTNDNLETIVGMLSKVVLKNGDFSVGYIDPFRAEGKNEEYDGSIHDYIYLWTFNNLDEKTQKYDVNDGINIEKINISEIEDIYSILYSHPRWGGRLTNKFWIDI